MNLQHGLLMLLVLQHLIILLHLQCNYCLLQDLVVLVTLQQLTLGSGESAHDLVVLVILQLDFVALVELGRSVVFAAGVDGSYESVTRLDCSGGKSST